MDTLLQGINKRNTTFDALESIALVLHAGYHVWTARGETKTGFAEKAYPTR